MSILEKHLPLVKEQIAFHDRMASRFANDEHRQRLHKITAEKFEVFQKDILEAEKLLSNISHNNGKTINSKMLTITPECLEGLPEALIKELSISDADRTEFTIINVIGENGGVANLDKILIGLYKKTKEVVTRNALTARLYRMIQKGLAYSVPGKKGVYSIRELTPEEIEKLL